MPLGSSAVASEKVPKSMESLISRTLNYSSYMIFFNHIYAADLKFSKMM